MAQIIFVSLSLFWGIIAFYLRFLKYKYFDKNTIFIKKNIKNIKKCSKNNVFLNFLSVKVQNQSLIKANQKCLILLSKNQNAFFIDGILLHNKYCNAFDFSFEFLNKKISYSNFISLNNGNLLYRDKQIIILIKIICLNEKLYFNYNIYNLCQNGICIQFAFKLNTSLNFTLIDKRFKINLGREHITLKGQNFLNKISKAKIENNNDLTLQSQFALNSKLDFGIELTHSKYKFDKLHSIHSNQLISGIEKTINSTPTNFSSRDFKYCKKHYPFFIENYNRIAFFEVSNQQDYLELEKSIIFYCAFLSSHFQIYFLVKCNNDYVAYIEKFFKEYNISAYLIFDNSHFPFIFNRAFKVYKTIECKENITLNLAKRSVQGDSLHNIETLTSRCNINLSEFDNPSPILCHIENAKNITKISNHYKILDTSEQITYLHFECRSKLTKNGILLYTNFEKKLIASISIKYKDTTLNNFCATQITCPFNFFILDKQQLNILNRQHLFNDMIYSTQSFIDYALIYLYSLIYLDKEKFLKLYNELKHYIKKYSTPYQFEIMAYLSILFCKIYNYNILCFFNSNFDILKLINLELNKYSTKKNYTILQTLQPFIKDIKLQKYLQEKLKKCKNFMKNSNFFIKNDNFIDVFWEFIFFINCEIGLEIANQNIKITPYQEKYNEHFELQLNKKVYDIKFFDDKFSINDLIYN